MNFKYLIGILVVIGVCAVLVGCTKAKKKEEEVVSGGWGINITDKASTFEEDVQDVYDKSIKDKYNPVALLGTQVVAGTNYMFLVTDKDSYRVVIVYKDLSGNVSTTNDTKFNPLSYAGKTIDHKSEELTGGWNVDKPTKGYLSDEKHQSIFDDAVSKYDKGTFVPIAHIATQVVGGFNYAYLCYGDDGIYVLTVYASSDKTNEVTSSAYVDLGAYNK